MTKKKIKNLSKENADVNINVNWGQDLEQAKDFTKDLTKILKPLQKKGLLEFKAFIYRKCDFCGKKLEKGDKFKTIGKKDKCEDCQKKKK